MSYLGIDFGTRNVGIAYCDETGSVAFPLKVVRNDRSLIDEVGKAAAEVHAREIVLGESKDYQGQDNPVMKDARAFAHEIERRLAIPVRFEPEFLTSKEARALQGEGGMHDASAAAIILQSFLDRRKAAATP